MSSHVVTEFGTSPAWLFGKLPRHGDFVARGLDQSARDRFDTWLSEAMIEARTALGPAFEDAYDTAPPWRFVQHDAATQWTGGALCASMDSAGRRFPLVVARSAEDAATATLAALGCELAVYRAFDEALDADQLWAIAATESPDGIPEPASAGWWTEGNDDFPPARTAAGFDPSLIVAMLRGGAHG